MTNKRIAITKGLYSLLIGSFIDFFSWNLLNQHRRLEDNVFLQSCYNSLHRSFPLQVANLFDKTKGTCSIRKYLKEIKKSIQQNDQQVSAQINEMLNQNNDKLERLNNRRGDDLAHNNLEIIQNIQEGKAKEKQSNKTKNSSITGKEIIECLLLAHKIYKIIAKHEFGTYHPFKNKLQKTIDTDFKKIF